MIPVIAPSVPSSVVAKGIIIKQRKIRIGRPIDLQYRPYAIVAKAISINVTVELQPNTCPN